MLKDKIIMYSTWQIYNFRSSAEKDNFWNLTRPLPFFVWLLFAFATFAVSAVLTLFIDAYREMVISCLDFYDYIDE